MIAFEKKYSISTELAHVIGCSEDTEKSRLEIAQGICRYVTKNNLQDLNHWYKVVPDKTLQLLFNLDPAIKNSVKYSEIQRLIDPHICLIDPHILTPIKIHKRKFQHVLSELNSIPKSQSNRRDLRRFARDCPGILYNDSSDSEDESNYKNVTGRSLL